jgi:uncharacterized membrane protein
MSKKQEMTAHHARVLLLRALVASSLVSAFLLFVRSRTAGNWFFLFMLWNLALAWLPLGFAWWLKLWLNVHRWFSWQGILLTTLWLGFLPNSFYLITDLIHLRVSGDVNLLFDAVMLVSFIFNGLALGFASLYVVHLELLKRMEYKTAHAVVTFVLLACSFAIYLGRYLRWNTWDILINPFGLLFDVSDRFINPAAFPRTFSTTATFFILLSSMYMVIWAFIRLARLAK